MRNVFQIAVVCAPAVLAGCLNEKDDLDPAAVARGKDLAETCTACHALQSDENRVGPTLAGVIGRTAGAVDGYAYSDDLASSGLVWSPEQIVAYLVDPYGLVPGTKMAAGEIPQSEAEDIVVYLQSLD